MSPDGTKLYQAVPVSDLASNTETYDELSELALELSENGGLKFRARNELNLKAGQALKNFPKKNVSDHNFYVRFLNKPKSFTIKSAKWS